MCGIAGALDPEPARAGARVDALNRAQHHRGPDHAALVRAGSVTLGNTRLAIQDLGESGNQPFRSADGRFVCVFNGEIYNNVELIEEFGLVLDSRCDGAVIPELWARQGAACLERLQGMYAIAMVDTVAGTLTLARDPFGIKPLYLRTLPDGTLAFASEVRPLAALHSTPPLSPTALTRYLHLGAVPGDMSPFEGIEAVAPNTALTIDPQGQRRSSAILAGEHPLTTSAHSPGSQALARALRQAVEQHLRSDVPVALLLSSGVDSATIACAARELGRSLSCLTVRGLGDADETSGAAATAAEYGHGFQIVEPTLDHRLVQSFFDAMQRPTIDGLNTFIVSTAVRQAGYRVALSGLGSDEALGGYKQFRLLRWLPWLRQLDRTPLVTKALHAGIERFGRPSPNPKLGRLIQRGGPRDSFALDLLVREVLPPTMVSSLAGIDPRDLAGRPHARGAEFRDLVEAEIDLYLRGMLLPDADAFSMSSSIELRVPFLDTKLFTTAAEVSAARRGGQPKRALADALDDPYLDRLLKRPKRGFALPMAQWLDHGPLRAFAERLERPGAPVWEWVSRPEAAARLNRKASSRWSEQWSLVALNAWLESLERGGTETGASIA